MAVPVVFASRAGECIGWFHAASGARRPAVVVMCRPLGYEALCSYSAYVQVAQALAQAGFDVLRFDYAGTGDAPGGDADPDRVGAWLASIEAAAEFAQRVSGAREVALFGMRIGATLAVEAARRLGTIGELMLWAPCASGRAFTREMRAAYGSHEQPGADLGGGVEALGTLFTAETLAALDALASDGNAAAPARRVYIAARDDLPGEGPLPARWQALGADVTTTTWPGYAEMMAEPHDAQLPLEALQSLTGWLATAHPQDEDRAPAPALAAPQPWRIGNVTESLVTFGDDGQLVGVMSQPASAPRNPRSSTAVLMLNVGGNYRVGPNRIYVKLARELAMAGYRALRLDVSGIGDSRVDASSPHGSMYRDDATGDVSAAIDMLVARGCTRIVLLGICSGAYLAFQTALRDARVGAQMIVNARLLEWDTEKNGPWQASMQQFYKSTRYYRQALLRGEVYGRLLRGEVNVRGIAGRFLDLGRARLRRLWHALLGRAPAEGVLPKMKHLCARGVDTLVAMSEQDDGLDYIEFHLGRGGARMRGHPNFRMELIPAADHTFSTVASQRALLRIVRDHLDRLHEVPAREPAVVARSIATT